MENLTRGYSHKESKEILTKGDLRESPVKILDKYGKAIELEKITEEETRQPTKEKAHGGLRLAWKNINQSMVKKLGKKVSREKGFNLMSQALLKKVPKEKIEEFEEKQKDSQAKNTENPKEKVAPEKAEAIPEESLPKEEKISSKVFEQAEINQRQEILKSEEAKLSRAKLKEEIQENLEKNGLGTVKSLLLATLGASGKALYKGLSKLSLSEIAYTFGSEFVYHGEEAIVSFLKLLKGLGSSAYQAGKVSIVKK